MQHTILTKRVLSSIISDTIKGKSLWRILSNHEISSVELSGDIIDLGSGHQPEIYYRLFRLKKPYSILSTDLYKTGGNTVKVNLERPFKLKGKIFDIVICFNVLEHIFNVDNVIKESNRYLKKNGTFLGSMPFLMRFHSSPNDYCRLTHKALIKIFESNGFICKKMVYVGFGPFTASVTNWITLLPSWLQSPFILLAIFIDLGLYKFSKYYKLKHPLGYFFIFEKKHNLKEALISRSEDIITD